MHPARPILLVALTAFALALSNSPASATPPAPPLEFTVRALESPRPGVPVTFVVEVTPLVACERLLVRVVVPADCALTRGSSLRSVPVPARGGAARLEYAVRIPQGLTRRIYVRATMETPGGYRFTRGENLVLLAGPSRETAPVHRVRPDGKGGAVLEFEGAPARAGAPGK